MRIWVVIFCCVLAGLLIAGAGGRRHQESTPSPTTTTPTTTSAPQRPGSQPAATGTAPASAKPQRIVLRVNRTLEVKGYLQLEDDDVIVVRDQQNNLQSFPKPRVGQIVRLVDPQPGQTGMVFMLDGQIREGIIIEDGFDFVVIEIEGIRANLKRSTVDHVVLSPTVEEQYDAYKKAMQPGDHDALYMLCKWLFEQKRYQLAHDELLDLLEHVEMPEARQLLNIVEAQLKLQPGNGPPPHPKPDNPAHGGDDRPQPPDAHNGDAADPAIERLLSDEDVNLIRVYEIDFEHPPRVTVTPDTVRTLIERYSSDSLIPASQTGRNALFRSASDNPLQVVRLMFQLRARDLYPKVQVNTEPAALNLFRQRVHDAWLINNCATNACHGNPLGGSGRFFLHRRDYKDDRVRYTNLLILDRLRLDPDWPLINYDRPEDSLIIQYALPRELARKPHPRVDGWKPVFTQASGRLKQQAIEWITSMMLPRPQYPVEYEPPNMGAPPATQPFGEDQSPTHRVPR